MSVLISAHHRESGDPVLSSVTPAFQDNRSDAAFRVASPKTLGPRFRGDERNFVY